MSSTTISATLCGELRRQSNHGARSSELAQTHDCSVGTIRYHIYGECGHEVEPDSLSPPEVGLPAPECRQIRTRYAAGEEINEIAESLDHTWRTTVRHLSGDCSHDRSDLVVEKREVLKRMPVTAQDCMSLRNSYADGNIPDLLELSQNVPWTYQTVLRHVNGSCGHDIDAPTRTVVARTNITKERCKEFRDRYRGNTDLTLSKLEPLVSDYEASAATIQRHVRFRCSHDPDSTLLDKVDGWTSLINEDSIEDQPTDLSGVDEQNTQSTTERGNESIDYATVALETGIHSPDEYEAVADLAEPDADRVETTTSRVVRNTQAANELKEQYQCRCQLCGEVRHKSPLEHYAEVHHIMPLGRPHKGPDKQSNMVVLCPNHHADFDHGLIHIDSETLEVTHATDETISGCELLVKDSHSIDTDMIIYNNSEISNLYALSS